MGGLLLIRPTETSAHAMAYNGGMRRSSLLALASLLSLSPACGPGIGGGEGEGEGAEGEGEGAEGEGEEPVISPIRIMQGGVDRSADGIDFGAIDEGAAGVELDVVLEAIPPNVDVAILSDPPVLLGGKDVDSFSVLVQPAATVSTAGAPFRIRFAPTVGGPLEAKLVLAFGVRAAERLVVDLRGESAAPAREPGLRTSIYDGDFDLLPDFDNLVPTSTTVLPTIDISERLGGDFYAYRFQGAVDVPAAGSWTFATTSDDGSRLFIDGALVVDNDGLHGPETVNGTVELSAGLHALEVTFFEKAGGDTLDVTWAGPGVDTEAIPAAALFTAP